MVVLVEARQWTVLCVSPWEQLGVVDVDTYLQLVARKRPTMQVGAQEASDRICAALRALAARAMGPGSKQHRGKATVRRFVEVLLVLGQAGYGDLVGRACDIVDEIERYLPNEVLCARQVGRVLTLLDGTGTALVERITDPPDGSSVPFERDIQGDLCRYPAAPVIGPSSTSVTAPVMSGRSLADDVLGPAQNIRRPAWLSATMSPGREPRPPPTVLTARCRPRPPPSGP